jgi:hypothetical protein
MLRNTRSKLMRIYNISFEVMTKFKMFIFRNVSQSANKSIFSANKSIFKKYI